MPKINIPDAALEAGARAAHNFAYKIDAADDPDQWDDMPDAYKENMRKEARAAFEAMVEAWPGMLKDGDAIPGLDGPPMPIHDVLILPMPTEASDE